MHAETHPIISKVSLVLAIIGSASVTIKSVLHCSISTCREICWTVVTCLSRLGLDYGAYLTRHRLLAELKHHVCQRTDKRACSVGRQGQPALPIHATHSVARGSGLDLSAVKAFKLSLRLLGKVLTLLLRAAAVKTQHLHSPDLRCAGAIDKKGRCGTLRCGCQQTEDS